MIARDAPPPFGQWDASSSDRRRRHVSDTADDPGPDRRDPVLEVRAHLQRALTALDQLRDILPGASEPDRRDKS